MKTTLAAITLAALSVTASHGVVTITGDPASGTGELEITEDITFTISTTGEFWLLVFDEWVTSDGHLTQSSQTPVTLAYSLNGVDSTTSDIQFADNLNLSANDVSANDGYLGTYTDPVAVNSGDIFVIKAGKWAMNEDVQLNPGIIGTFTGSVFLADDDGIRISNILTVPEPSSALLLGLGVFRLSLRRRRSK